MVGRFSQYAINARKRVCHRINHQPLIRNIIRVSRIFITGSSDGLGLMAARLLIADGHHVVLHGRDPRRAEAARAQAPGAAGSVVGDLTSRHQCRDLARQADALGPFDAVIHNAAIGFREKRRILTEDGLPHVLAANTIAPFILTATMKRPKRLIFISSELHRRRGSPDLDDLLWERRGWNGNQAYSDTKLHVVLLAFAIARRWTDVRSNALEPGWVATKMGGANATGDLDQAPRTQIWLAVSDEPAATVSGEYFFHRRPRTPHRGTRDLHRQEELIERCEALSGVTLPAD